MYIKGGYYLKARIIQEKKISNAPPHIREIWDYLLMNANHKDNSYGNYHIKRGQLFRTYQDIREALAWFVGWRKIMYTMNQVKSAMKFLRTHQCITTRKQPGGSLITILNYDEYQNPKNYEATYEATLDSTNPCRNNKNDKKENIFSEESLEYKLSKLLLDLILERNSKLKRPNLQKWADNIRLLIKRDKRTPFEIRKVIEWCQADDFWKSNILSTDKLRKQFDQLSMKMQDAPPAPKQTIMVDAFSGKDVK